MAPSRKTGGICNVSLFGSPEVLFRTIQENLGFYVDQIFLKAYCPYLPKFPIPSK
jgi:hypothetical protein